MKILFLCPHNAAKSVIAAALLQQAAQQQGLSLEVTSAGTEPSAQVATSVVARLAQDGLDVAAHRSVRVTADQLYAADRVISLGCSLAELEGIAPEIGQSVILWAEIPLPSQDLAGAYDAIAVNVTHLLHDLSQP
jgi:protein-tyrosine-phosphatase